MNWVKENYRILLQWGLGGLLLIGGCGLMIVAASGLVNANYPEYLIVGGLVSGIGAYVWTFESIMVHKYGKGTNTTEDESQPLDKAA